MTQKTVFIDGIEVTLETVGEDNDVIVTKSRDGTESFVESLAEDVAEHYGGDVSVAYVEAVEHKDGVYSVKFDVSETGRLSSENHTVFAAYRLNTFVVEGFIPLCVHGTTVWLQDVKEHDYIAYDA